MIRISVEASREECNALVELLSGVVDVQTVLGPSVLRPNHQPVTYVVTLDARLRP